MSVKDRLVGLARGLRGEQPERVVAEHAAPTQPSWAHVAEAQKLRRKLGSLQQQVAQHEANLARERGKLAEETSDLERFLAEYSKAPNGQADGMIRKRKEQHEERRAELQESVAKVQAQLCDATARRDELEREALKQERLAEDSKQREFGAQLTALKFAERAHADAAKACEKASAAASEQQAKVSALESRYTDQPADALWQETERAQSECRRLTLLSTAARKVLTQRESELEAARAALAQAELDAAVQAASEDTLRRKIAPRVQRIAELERELSEHLAGIDKDTTQAIAAGRAANMMGARVQLIHHTFGRDAARDAIVVARRERGDQTASLQLVDLASGTDAALARHEKLLKAVGDAE
jgi:chromosome segregation ATPase